MQQKKGGVLYILYIVPYKMKILHVFSMKIEAAGIFTKETREQVSFFEHNILHPSKKNQLLPRHHYQECFLMYLSIEK